MALRCPSCKYTTQNGPHMEDHKRNTGHGQEKKAETWTTVAAGNKQLRVRVKHNGPKADQLRKKQALKAKRRANKT